MIFSTIPFATRLTATLFAISSLVNLAQAGIINTANDSFIDQDTQLEWLDLNITSNQSYNSVVDNLAEDGIYYGWRLASFDEVLTLHHNAFFTVADEWREDRGGNREVNHAYANADRIIDQSTKNSSFDNLFDAIGYGLINDEYTTTQGLFEDNNGGLGYFQLHDDKDGNVWDSATLSWGYGSITDIHRTEGYPFIGTMLVRGAFSSGINVPEPSTLVIFALGAIGLAFSRKNKRAITTAKHNNKDYSSVR